MTKDSSTKEPEKRELSHPMLYDHYEIERVLGQGAMGTVYLARDLRIGRLAALKTLRKPDEKKGPADSLSEEFLARFRREAEVCGSLIHPNIVTLYEVGYSHREIKYLAMEFVEGESLLSILKQKPQLGLLKGTRIALDILRGLSYAHERGIVHRDIKPANILVTTDGRAKVADFGVARTAREGVSYATKAGQLLGTPYYMSPEAVAGKQVDERSDLFSVGALLYEMWTGKRPFEGETVMDVLYDVVNRHPAPAVKANPELPPWCDRFLGRLMAKSPSERFLSAHLAAEELERLLDIQKSRQSRADSDTVTPRKPLEVNIDDEMETHRLESNSFTWTRLKILHVPNEVAYGVIIVLLAILVLSPVFMREETVPIGPVLPPATERELQEKARLLERAKVLEEAEAWELSFEAYDEVLRKYPDTPSAIEGRQRVREYVEPLEIESLDPEEE